MTNTKALREMIAKRGLKLQFVAKSLGLSRYGLQRKMENQSEFRSGEIVKFTSLLALTTEERDNIFFA